MATTARGLRYPTSADDVRPYEDIGFLAEDVDDEFDLVAGDKQALSQLSGGGTSSSATNVNMPASSSRALTKLTATTRVRVEFSCSSFATVAGTEIAFAINVNGVDTDISRFRFNAANTHATCPTGVIYISGLAAGAWTFQARWRRTVGTGVMTMDTSDWITVDVQEVI